METGSRDGRHKRDFSQVEAKPYHLKLLIPGTRKRKLFGLLERPSLPPSAPQVCYKLFMYGKAGAGKTYVMCKLLGIEPPSQHLETVGVQCSHIYWPMKIGPRLMLFKLEIWDAGEATLKRYNHILPECRESVDAVLVCFSINDRESWSELPQVLASAAQPTDRAAVIPIATRCDKVATSEVAEEELTKFEEKYKNKVLRIGGGHSSDELASITPILNYLCNQLWQRDQELLSVK